VATVDGRIQESLDPKAFDFAFENQTEPSETDPFVRFAKKGALADA
jgi:hypothetical protein